MTWYAVLLIWSVSTSASASASAGRWTSRTDPWHPRELCFSSALSIARFAGGATRVGRGCGGRRTDTLSRPRNAWTTRPSAVRTLSMGFGGGATDRYSWDETDKELNIRIRMPAWAKGKSVRLDLHKTHIKLVLKEEEDNPIIEGDLRGIIRLDGSYWTMEALDDGGNMLYLTLEKMPEVTGLGPWMGVVQGERQVDSDYPEEKKAEELAAKSQRRGGGGEGDDEGDLFFEDPDRSKPRHTGEVDEDGFCQDRMVVQAMSDVMIARQVPRNGNALFAAVSASEDYLTTGEHPSVDLEAVEPKAKDLRKKAIDYLSDAFKEGKQILLEGKSLSARELVEAQAMANGMADGEEYLKGMRDNTMWGGGAEVAALTHVLERPIHVYELQATSLRFGLKRIGVFGMPKYQAKEAIHVLSTYGKFPELDPGTQTGDGNHFLALFPEESVPAKNKR